MTRLLALPLTLMLLLGSCFGTGEQREDRIQEPVLPVASFEWLRKPYEPYSLKFRLAVINFVDQTGAGGNLVKTIPDVLTTGLYDTQRFDLYDRGQLRELSLNDLEEQQQKLPVDGMLQGAITQIRPADKIIVCDIRVTNRFTNAVMYANSAEFRYTGALDVLVNRDDVNLLSTDIADSFPKLDERQDVRVLDISGNRVTISAGADQRLKTGMTALVYTKGDLTRDMDSGEVLSSFYYVGQVSIVSVLDRVAKAQIDAGQPLVGDTVIFK